MISQLSGKLVALAEQTATLGVSDYMQMTVFIPDFVRRQLQKYLGEQVTLRTMLVLDGDPQRGRMTPKLIGFLTAAEMEFFDLVCSVDGVGQKKALRAMTRPVREVATAIEEQDVKALSALPGIGPAMAERIVAKLRRKMAKFALMLSGDVPEGDEADRSVVEEAYEALVALGHSPTDARDKIEQATDGKKAFKTVEALLQEIYKRQRDA